MKVQTYVLFRVTSNDTHVFEGVFGRETDAIKAGESLRETYGHDLLVDVKIQKHEVEIPVFVLASFGADCEPDEQQLRATAYPHSEEAEAALQASATATLGDCSHVAVGAVDDTCWNGVGKDGCITASDFAHDVEHAVDGVAVTLDDGKFIDWAIFTA